MESSRSPTRHKRESKVLDDSWDCSVCTYRNTAEAFKCLMCDVRKGTSTRKPKLQTPQDSSLPSKMINKDESRDKANKEPNDPDAQPRKRRKMGRLENIDRSSAESREVTVNDVTVVITEYQLLKKAQEKARQKAAEAAAMAAAAAAAAAEAAGGSTPELPSPSSSPASPDPADAPANDSVDQTPESTDP